MFSVVYICSQTGNEDLVQLTEWPSSEMLSCFACVISISILREFTDFSLSTRYHLPCSCRLHTLVESPTRDPTEV